MNGPSDDRSAESATLVDPPVRPGEAAVIEAVRLFGGRREVVIAHAGQRYRLRITQNGKLILTK